MMGVVGGWGAAIHLNEGVVGGGRSGVGDPNDVCRGRGWSIRLKGVVGVGWWVRGRRTQMICVGSPPPH
jgi:hypothetical protein